MHCGLAWYRYPVHGITELTQMRYGAILILEFALFCMINQALLKFRKTVKSGRCTKYERSDG